MTPPLTPALIRSGLSTCALGSTIECHASLTSTQDRARELAAAGASHGTAIFAEAQTAGRGRHGRVWDSAPGLGLWCSVIVRSTWPRDRDVGLTAAAACAVADVLEREGALRPRLRWPNDVLIGEKKVAGVLVEVTGGAGTDRTAIIGIGLNSGHRASDLPAALRGEATSIRRETRRLPDRAALARALLVALEHLLDDLAGRRPPALAESWRRRLSLEGRTVVYASGGEERSGVVESVDLFRGLRVVESGRSRLIRAEHVEWIRPEVATRGRSLKP